MKLDAHPLVVAVALGLLGPTVLEEEDSDSLELSSSATTLEVQADTWAPGPPPLASEFHRVEIEWLAARES